MGRPTEDPMLPMGNTLNGWPAFREGRVRRYVASGEYSREQAERLVDDARRSHFEPNPHAPQRNFDTYRTPRSRG